MNREKILKLFENPETHKFFKAITWSIFDVYKSTYASIFNEFQNEKGDGFCPRGKDLYPHHRRAKTDLMLVETSSAFSTTKASTAKNKIGNCSHAEVKIGCFTITASAVDGPNEMVRQAFFRGTLANSSQADLFLSNEIPEMDDYYGIIIHGNDTNNFKRPSFVRFAFPHIDYKEYFLNIDLIKYFGIAINKNDEKPAIKDNTKPRIRKNIKKQKSTNLILSPKSKKITRRNF